jgi:hypothetical protein
MPKVQKMEIAKWSRTKLCKRFLEPKMGQRNVPIYIHSLTPPQLYEECRELCTAQMNLANQTSQKMLTWIIIQWIYLILLNFW